MSGGWEVALCAFCLAVVLLIGVPQKVRAKRQARELRDRFLEARETQLLLMARGEDVPDELVETRLRLEERKKEIRRPDPRFRDRASTLPDDAPAPF